eukprot:7603649-Ditylum_brightwellii.AAC.1
MVGTTGSESENLCAGSNSFTPQQHSHQEVMMRNHHSQGHYDDNGNLASSLPESDQEANKMEEEKEVEMRNGNDDDGSEVYGKDDKLVSSLPELDQEANKMEEKKEVE